jgi:subtilisin family serine protease
MRKLLLFLLSAAILLFPSPVDAKTAKKKPTFRAVDNVPSAPGAAWAQDRVNQPWDKLDGRTLAGAQMGSGITVYVIDTGVGSGDCHGHGSFMASLVNSPSYGIATLATVVGVKALDCNGTGTLAQVIAAVRWVDANAEYSSSIVNMSLGGNASPELDAVVNALAVKMPVVVAAGNESTDACFRSPARAKSAITVAAMTKNHLRSIFSNWGKCVDIWAPGSAIDGLDRFGNPMAASGTSPATALVSAAIAYIADRDNSTTMQAALTVMKESSDIIIIDGRTNGVKPYVLWIRDNPYRWIRTVYPSSLN